MAMELPQKKNKFSSSNRTFGNRRQLTSVADFFEKLKSSQFKSPRQNFPVGSGGNFRTRQRNCRQLTYQIASKCHINLGNIEEAKQICDKIVNLSPNLTSLIADELEKIKSIEGLEAEFTKLNSGGNHQLSLMILDKISKLCPHSQKNNILRAQLHVYQGLR